MAANWPPANASSVNCLRSTQYAATPDTFSNAVAVAIDASIATPATDPLPVTSACARIAVRRFSCVTVKYERAFRSSVLPAFGARLPKAESTLHALTQLAFQKAKPGSNLH